MPALKNSATRYGWVSLVLHWGMAVVIIGLFVAGEIMVDLGYYSPWYHRLPSLHKAIGILLAIALAVRIIWHFFSRVPRVSDDLPSWQRIAAIIVHKCFYVGILMTIMSGYFISTAEGQGIQVLSFFEVPSLGSFVENQEDIAGEWHSYLANALIALVSVHAMASLKHHFIDKDDTLSRMFGK